MINSETGEFISSSVFLERYLILKAVRQVVGNSVSISFECTDEFNLSDKDYYAGYFGS